MSKSKAGTTNRVAGVANFKPSRRALVIGAAAIAGSGALAWGLLGSVESRRYSSSRTMIAMIDGKSQHRTAADHY